MNTCEVLKRKRKMYKVAMQEITIFLKSNFYIKKNTVENKLH